MIFFLLMKNGPYYIKYCEYYNLYVSITKFLVPSLLTFAVGIHIFNILFKLHWTIVNIILLDHIKFEICVIKIGLEQQGNNAFSLSHHYM